MTIVRKHKRRTNKGLTRVKQHNRKVRVLNRFGVVKFPTKKEKIAIEQFKRDMETKKVRKKKRQAGYYYGGKDKEQMKALAEFLDRRKKCLLKLGQARWLDKHSLRNLRIK